MATEAKKISKVDQVLNKIDAFFESLFSSTKKGDDDMEEDEMDDDTDASAENEAPSTGAAKKGKKGKKSTDDEDSQDPDDDDDDDDDDEKDTDMKKDAEIKRLNSIIAKQNTLLKEAQTQLGQTEAEVRETIKSTFKPSGSQRSTKNSAVKTEVPSWAAPQTDLAKKAAKLASNRNK